MLVGFDAAGRFHRRGRYSSDSRPAPKPMA
jgi:hypothetical protein